MLDVITSINERSAPELYAIAQASSNNPDLVQALIHALQHQHDVVRRNSEATLLNLAENQPESLYPHWGLFEKMLSSPLVEFRAFALQVIAALTTVDDEYRFEKIFPAYFRLLDDPDVTIACYAAWCAGVIALHSPHLERQITRRLLAIDRTHHRESHKQLIKAEVIKSFRRYYLQSHNPDILLEFARRQLNASRPTTRIVAQEFLEEFNPV